MRTCVIFDTRYGNTEKVARVLAKGIQESSVEVLCSNIREVSVEALIQSDLLAIGGPTEFHGASGPMKEFLRKLKQADLRGKYGFAFDTRVNSWWSGSAAKLIENTLKASGMEILRPHSSAFVIRTKGKADVKGATGKTESKEEKEGRRAREKEERRASAVLEEGMLESFEKIGAEIGRALASKALATRTAER